MTSPQSDDWKRARASFVQEALEAWQEYQATGLHFTMEEAAAWLETWGTEDETPAPQPHR